MELSDEEKRQLMWDWKLKKREHFVDTVQCYCNREYNIAEKVIIEFCPVCGHRMCPGCKEQHGRLNSNYCFKEKDIKIVRNPLNLYKDEWMDNNDIDSFSTVRRDNL